MLNTIEAKRRFRMTDRKSVEAQSYLVKLAPECRAEKGTICEPC